MNKNNGGQVYPTLLNLPIEKEGNIEVRRIYHSGMTLRQWYAGMAMQGFLASNEKTHYLFEHESSETAKRMPPDEMARLCCEYADSMIEEREK